MALAEPTRVWIGCPAVTVNQPNPNPEEGNLVIQERKLKAVLTAVMAAERAPWDVVDALVEAIPYENGRAPRGSLQEVADYIVKNGAGDRYNADYIGALRKLGEAITALKRGYLTTVRASSVRMAMLVLVDRKSTISADRAIELLVQARADGWTLRQLASKCGAAWSDTTVSEPERKAIIAAASPEEIVERVAADPKLAAQAATEALSNPKVAKQVFRDPATQVRASNAIDAYYVENPPPVTKKTDPKGTHAFLDVLTDMVKVEKHLEAIVKNINEARKVKELTPTEIREFTARARNYLDAIDEIAGSRNGLTDEALQSWMGGE